MRYTSDIYFDGICIYLTSELKAATIPKLFLVLINIAAWVGFVVISIYIPGEEVISLIFPTVLIPLLLIFFLVRFTAWNLWGKEYLVINTKSITYMRSYGLIETKNKTIRIEKKLFAGFKKIKVFQQTEYGILEFWDYDQNDYPRIIFETAILMTKASAEDVISLIVELYNHEFFERKQIIPFTAN